MAEAALFTIASSLLSSIASNAFKKAYERARSILEASDELQELKETITSIQAVLLDAEKQHNDSAKVKDWIGRVREVLYDAEDLFDKVVTDDLLLKAKKSKEVRFFFFKPNPIGSRDFIAKKVKTIRKDLHRIYHDMALFGFVKCESEEPISGMRKGVETGSIVGPEEVIGRDDEKEQIVNFICDEAYDERNISLISIVGIGGMGKSALAQLVYNDSKIRKAFQHRYWACISDVFDEKEVLGKIYQSKTRHGQYRGLSLHQVQSIVRESIDLSGKFLLVLDDLWDEDTTRGTKLWSILSSEKAKGSKIIITTRHLSVGMAMRADETLELKGLSNDASWELFRRYAFTKEQENDPTWINIGQTIVRKCANVPLAIKSIASLLRVKDTIGEWKSLENEQLSKIGLSDNPIMSALRMSYNHLPSHLKNCFAYCSLFPKDSVINKQELICLWIAQGYIQQKKGETLEMAGHACFMELFRRSFFQEVSTTTCKMHDLVHDLAQDVAGEESCIITIRGMNQAQNKIRHISVASQIDDASNSPLSLLEVDRLRTSLFTFEHSCKYNISCRHSCTSQPDKEITKFKLLRALSLKKQSMKSVSSSIGEMKHLRYLNLSGNQFTHLPDAITKLVNLITLDVSDCCNLKELPREIRELVGLRHLYNDWCTLLVCMPPTLGELTSLERLSLFRVSESGGAVTCGLDALAKLNLRGSLRVLYDSSVECCKDDVLLDYGQVPDTLETLEILHYPSRRMPVWWRHINPPSSLPKLENLTIRYCSNLNNLAPLRCLPFLQYLYIGMLPALEYVEDDEVASITPFFPSLRILRFISLRNLKGWSRPNVTFPHLDHPLTFPFLSKLFIESCLKLDSWPPIAPHMKEIRLNHVRGDLVQQFTSKPYTRLDTFAINGIGNLTNFAGEGLASLRELEITDCENLKKVRVSSSNIIEELSLRLCPNMDLWEKREKEERSLDWTSFTNLRKLVVDRIPKEGRLHEYLQQLTSLGNLKIYGWTEGRFM